MTDVERCLLTAVTMRAKTVYGVRSADNLCNKAQALIDIAMESGITDIHRIADIGTKISLRPTNVKREFYCRTIPAN